MKESEFEGIICKYPELIEDGLSFKGRQVSLQRKLVDILFEDRHGQKLIIELKKGTVTRKHIAQLLDYEGYFISLDNPTARVMLVGNRVPLNLKRSLEHHGFEWKELPIEFLIDFLTTKKDNENLFCVTSEKPLVGHLRSSNHDKMNRNAINSVENKEINSPVPISEMTKQELNKLSKELVEKKLIDIFTGHNLRFSGEDGRTKGTLNIFIGSKKLSVSVKSKRIRVWPNIRGIKYDNEFIVFVDYYKKQLPSPEVDFYVINSQDWQNLLDIRLTEVRARKPTERIEIDKSTNTPIFIDQLKKSGKPYMGIDLSVSHLRPYKDRWERLV